MPYIIILLVSLAVHCPSAQAKTEITKTESNLAAALKECSQIDSDYGRLVCYDKLGKQKKNVSASENDSQESMPQTLSKTTDNEATPSLSAKQLPALLADIDEPALMVSFGQMDLLGEEFSATLIGLGNRVNVFDIERDKGADLHANIFGHIRSQFDVDELNTRNNRGGALINTDFSVGGELAQIRTNWQWRIGYIHRSTHLGDEFLIENQDYLDKRINLSYERIDFLALKSLHNWDIYAGGAFITRKEPSELNNFQWQAGWQFAGDTFGPAKPVIGMDFKSWAAAERPINMTLRAGLEFNQWFNQPFKVLFEYQEGHGPYGQFYSEDFRYYGLTLYNEW